MALDKAFDNIEEADLRQLIENNVSEQKTVEYKELLPENSHESKREFLADVSSFANTVGGHIIFGIKEENGIPIELSGLEGDDFDSELLRLENLLRDAIQPRIQGVSMRVLPIEGSKPVIILRIPQSWSKPHVVNFQGHWRFYARNSAGKYPLDALELKSAFLATTALGEKVRNFHFDRLSKISSDETPIPLVGKARIILHLIPYSAFEAKSLLSFTSIENDIWSLTPIYASISGYRHNLDGIVTYSESRNEFPGAYTQFFRNGIIESVSARVFSFSGEEPYIPSVVLEEELINSLKAYISIHQKYSISPPSVIMVSLIGVRGYKLAVSQSLDRWHEHTHLIDRETLLLPETIVEDYSINAATLLHPIFDAVWNSAGWPRSYGYNESGDWGKGPNFRR